LTCLQHNLHSLLSLTLPDSPPQSVWNASMKLKRPCDVF